MIDEETEIVNRSFAVALDSGARTVSLWPRFSSEHRASETSARTGHVIGHFQAQGAGEVARDVPDRARTPFANKPCVHPFDSPLRRSISPVADEVRISGAADDG